MNTKLTTSLIGIVINIVEFLIGLRIVLKLFGAASTAPFVNWIYETTAPLLQPFQGMFPSPRLSGGFILEFSALFALIAYAFLGYLIITIVHELTYYSTRERKSKRK